MRPFLPLALTFVLLPALNAQAQSRFSPTPFSSAPALSSAPTLSQAMAASHSSTPCLSVGAERVPLAPQMTLPAPGASAISLAQAFGRVTRRFGSITAIAPPTMTVFYTPAGPPDGYADLQPGDALKLLAASLTPAQWSLLTGAQGIGLADLATDEQRSLFHTLFPGDKLIVTGGKLKYDPVTNQPPNFGAELPQAHIRLSQKVSISLSRPGDGHGFSGIGISSDTPQTNYVLQNSAAPKNTRAGQKTHDEVPNAPKKGQLDFRSPLLQTRVSLAGVKTVADALRAVAAATHLEIYADRHYETRAVTLLGTPTTPLTAAEVLQALAFCVTGTYRQVGPAYVLADDIMGTATRIAIWDQFTQEAAAQLQGPLGAAGDKLTDAHSARDLYGQDDPLAVTPAQSEASDKANADQFNPWRDTTLTLPFSQLTPAQQGNATRMADEFRKMPENANSYSIANGVKITAPPDTSGPIMLTLRPALEIIIPSLDAPVKMQDPLFNLFQPSQKKTHFLMDQWARKQTKPNSAKPPVKRLLSAVMTPIPRRALLASLQTSVQVSALIRAMKTAGFNQLWLRVFTHGKESNNALLATALRETKGTGIAVFAVLDLLRWGPNTPPEAVDLTVLGETTREANARIVRMRTLNGQTEGLLHPEPSEGDNWVLPTAPSVRAVLAPLVRRLAARPGLAGMVWEGVAPPAYTPLSQMTFGDSGDSMGYNLSMRLAFLRKSHADPLDVTVGATSGLMPDGADFQSQNDNQAVAQDWSKFRNDADLLFLRRLYASSVVGGQPPRLLVYPRRAGMSPDSRWYGAWNNPKANPPDNAEFLFGPDALKKIKAQTRLAYYQTFADATNWSQILPDELFSEFSRQPWDGFVLDLGTETSLIPAKK